MEIQTKILAVDTSEQGCQPHVSYCFVFIILKPIYEIIFLSLNKKISIVRIVSSIQKSCVSQEFADWNLKKNWNGSTGAIL